MQMLNLPLSEELQTTFSKAKGQASIRSLKIVIENEKLVLSSTGTASSISLDFNSFQKSLTDNETCYVVFRYKDTFATAPWALIMYTPDSCPVKDKMMYASSFVATRDALGGTKLFSKLKRFSSPSDFVWSTFQNSESDDIDEDGATKPKVLLDASKPWNKRELAIQQLEKEEEQARQEFSQIAHDKQPTAASGFSQVSFPLTKGVEGALRELEAGSINWIQLSLDNPATKIDVVSSKSVNSNALSCELDPVEPQFYLYRNAESVYVLIYCCPDMVSSAGYSQTIKNRMIYSTCKATCAESIKALGISPLKKFDVRDPSELTDAALTLYLRSKVATMFTGAQLKGAPVQNTRPGYNQSAGSSVNAASKQRKPPEGSLAGLMANTGTKKNIPKGVVLPPSGAYC